MAAHRQQSLIIPWYKPVGGGGARAQVLASIGANVEIQEQGKQSVVGSSESVTWTTDGQDMLGTGQSERFVVVVEHHRLGCERQFSLRTSGNSGQRWHRLILEVWSEQQRELVESWSRSSDDTKRKRDHGAGMAAFAPNSQARELAWEATEAGLESAQRDG
eukprot:1021057-Rhodomonas_salina.1